MVPRLIKYADAHGTLVVIIGSAPGIVNSVEIIDCPMETVRVNGTDRIRIDAESAAEIVRLLELPRHHGPSGGGEVRRQTTRHRARSYKDRTSAKRKGILVSAGLTVRTVKPQT